MSNTKVQSSPQRRARKSTRRRPKGLFETVEAEIKLRGYSPKTAKAYLGALRRFVAYFQPHHPHQLNEDDIRHYLLYLIEEKQLSPSTVNQTISALRFLYVALYHRDFTFQSIKRPKRKRKLPVILSRDEILRIISTIQNRKHRLMIELMYAAGLRVSEVVQLRVQDVNLDELTIFVRGGKGKKDRLTIFSESLREPLRRQMEGREAGDLVFPSQRGGRLTTRSIQKVFKKALWKSGVRKNATCHSLRHSFATHLLEVGTDIRYIQELLGHKRLETSRVYTHVANPARLKIKSPF